MNKKSQVFVFTSFLLMILLFAIISYNIKVYRTFRDSSLDDFSENYKSQVLDYMNKLKLSSTSTSTIKTQFNTTFRSFMITRKNHDTRIGALGIIQYEDNSYFIINELNENISVGKNLPLTPSDIILPGGEKEITSANITYIQDTNGVIYSTSNTYLLGKKLDQSDLDIIELR